jgi:hypothetical protein
LDTLFIGNDTDNKENYLQSKSYTREFKIRAVQLMGESSKPICRLAEKPALQLAEATPGESRQRLC